MRLLHTSSLQLVEFFGANIPSYAILSHTWEEGEVIFQDFQNPEQAKLKTGYDKLAKACDRACLDELEWIWIDTCCINKESSAELTEAINSMYSYYRDSRICYAYLMNVRKSDGDPNLVDSTFTKCKWFTRGWTLQELLAPANVVFYDKDWIEIGTKYTLRSIITAVTGIPFDILMGADSGKISVAKKMSWAAHRVTTREEDCAYSLMGIFRVHMPTMYGEGGRNAFMRLQLQIIKSSDDRSIFAWCSSSGEYPDETGLLARSPYDFRHSGDVQISSSDHHMDLPYSMTNRGLQIHLPLQLVKASSGVYLASLDCQVQRGNELEHLGVYLREKHGQKRQFMRCRPEDVALIPPNSPALHSHRKEVYVMEPSTEQRRPANSSETWYTFHLKRLPAHFNLIEFVNSTPFRDKLFGNDYARLKKPDTSATSENDAVANTCLELRRPCAAALKFQNKSNGELFLIIIGSHSRTGVFTEIVTNYERRRTIEILDSYRLEPGDSIPHYQDRVSRYLKREGATVSVAVRPGKQNHYMLEIDVSPGQIEESVPIGPPPPDCGFMLELAVSDADYELKEVYPEDRFLRRHSQSQIYVSIDNDALHPSRILVFETRLGGEEKIAIALGIRQDFRPWADILTEAQFRNQTLQEILESYSSSGFKCNRQQKRCTRVVDNGSTHIEVRVVAEKRTALGNGSHWAQITFDHYTPISPINQHGSGSGWGKKGQQKGHRHVVGRRRKGSKHSHS
ncbi:hypothetical protein VKT23_000332 [Stygiomarasmius scandens]|uniref:Heterokaryon incompatibility domain-containing protein n=1 Tax=Marasmiellus scandens TaxID=2682957 RepID=A0ABR1K6A5_9AGAR